MSTRREFLVGSLALAGAAMVRGDSRAWATSFPAGLIYTKDAPGRWKGKEDLHAPKVTVEGRKISVLTPHPMSPQHFIVKHTLVGNDGRFFGEKIFTGTDPQAASEYVIPDDFIGVLRATSFCNLHDFWLTEFEI